MVKHFKINQAHITIQTLLAKKLDKKYGPNPIKDLFI
jgi:hypothetical protein